jgi:hypothetical protein
MRRRRRHTPLISDLLRRYQKKQKGKLKVRNLKVVLLFLAVVLALSACGGGGSGDQTSGQETATLPPSGPASSEATTSPTQEAAAPTAASAEEDLNLSTLTGGLAAFSSYKSAFTMTFAGKDEQGQPVNGTWTMEEDLIQQPRAQRVAMTTAGFSEGQAGNLGTFEIITIGDMSYMLTQDAGGAKSCISMSSGEATDSQQGLFNPDMIGGVSDAKYVGTETVNGVRAKHYAWKETSLPVFGFASSKGDVWMATDGDYVVKYLAEATGKGTLFGSAQEEGTITVEYNLTDVNGSFTIEVPAECEGPATDIPVMADAQDKSTFGEMISYSSASALADVTNFYKAEMPNNGWQASGEPMIAEGFATLEFTKEGRTAQLMLSYDTDTQMTSVIITTSKQE